MLSILLPESDESMLEILFVVILRNITVFLLQKHNDSRAILDKIL